MKRAIKQLSRTTAGENIFTSPTVRPAATLSTTTNDHTVGHAHELFFTRQRARSAASIARKSNKNSNSNNHNKYLRASLSTYKVNFGDTLADTPLECYLTKYSTLAHFCMHHNLSFQRARYEGLGGTSPSVDTWRLTPATIGHFRACPNLRGVACATNGVDLYVEREGGVVVKGHLDNWIEDEKIENKISGRINSRSASSEDARNRNANRNNGVLTTKRKKTLEDLLTNCLA